jgi:hypothetical protein
MAESKTVLVATDFGLEQFIAGAAGLDNTDTPHNLITGTEYAVLNSSQGEKYATGSYELRPEDEIRYLGAFSLLFTNPPSTVQSRKV